MPQLRGERERLHFHEVFQSFMQSESSVIETDVSDGTVRTNCLPC
jgi:hypothetical protein